MDALERALRDAMPGWFGMWTDRSTATLLTAIAQAVAAAPPAGTGLRQTGQGTVAEARLLSSTRSKQAWQNWWPHGVTTTCQGSSRQSGQTG